MQFHFVFFEQLFYVFNNDLNLFIFIANNITFFPDIFLATLYMCDIMGSPQMDKLALILL